MVGGDGECESIGEPDLEASVHDADGVATHGFVGARSALAGGDVEFPAVERAEDFAVLDGAGAERAAAVGALAVDGAEAAADVEHGDFVFAHLHGEARVGRELAGLADGDEFAHGGGGDGSRDDDNRRFDPNSQAGRGKPTGGTGNLPVSRGNLPRGKRKAPGLFGAWFSEFSILSVPPGQWPGGTGW